MSDTPAAMTAELEARQVVQDDTEATTDALRRERSTVAAPPPLEPKLTSGWPRDLRLALAVGVLALAGVAHLTGAPLFVSLSLLALGVTAVFVFARTRQDEDELAAQLRDQSDRSRAEIEQLSDRMWELQESEERFRGLTDALGDIVIHRDREGRIVYANRVLADLVGVEPRRLAGHTLAELGIDIGLVPDVAFADGECLTSTDVAIRGRRGVRWFSWIELSVRDTGSNAVSHRAIARDITDRKRAETALINARERAEEASKAKSRFLATVSHEIRTPMNGIVGMTRLLADTSLEPEQRTYVNAISTSASALLALIEDLLDYSKIEAGRLELEPQPVAVRELVEHVVELLASRAYSRKIGIGCHIERRVPSLIVADPGRLRQVLLNLVGNAIKFTEVGGVLVTVEVAERDGKPRLVFAVTDTGPGLAEADAQRLFGDFEQGDSTSTRRHGGAGLGLAISKRIVEAMKGTLSAATGDGGGSVFTVDVPLEPIEAGESDRAANSLAGIDVLVMTKNAMEGEAIARIVADHGGNAVVAGTAEEAAKGFPTRHKCDVLLVDAHLETLERGMLVKLRENGFGAARTVTLIAPNDRGRLTELRATGYSRFVPRPVRSETLLRTILSDREARPEVAAGERAQHDGQAAPAAGALSVLIAEDNDINAMLARAVLVKAGHAVEVVDNGKAAVDMVTGGVRRFDIVLLDLHMPVMDGLDAIAEIRRHERETDSPAMPIMVLSADGQERTRHVVIAHGATGFLTKPLDPATLVDSVEDQVAA